MKIVKINPDDIKDWESFHDLFSQLFNFPDYYGRNMNAWIDCMEDIISEPLVLDFSTCQDFKQRCPEIVDAILDCSAFLNFRSIEGNTEPKLLISMFT